MISVSDSFPEGTSFFDVNGIPVTWTPGSLPVAWTPNPRTGDDPPRPFGIQTLTSDGAPMTESDWRKLFVSQSNKESVGEKPT